MCARFVVAQDPHVLVDMICFTLDECRSLVEVRSSTSFWNHFASFADLFAAPHAPYNVLHYVIMLVGC